MPWPSWQDLYKAFNACKREDYPFVTEVASRVQEGAFIDFGTAVKNWRDPIHPAGPPRFRKKIRTGAGSFRTASGVAQLRYDGKRRIRLPVIGLVKLANMLPYTIPAGDDPDVFYPDKDDGTVFQSILESEIVREIGYVLNYNGVFPSDAPDVLIDRRSYIYYEMNNPEARVAADFHVTIGVDAAAIIADWVFMTWRVGKAPDFVLEVASIPDPFFPPDPSENELAAKRELYERLGVTEYWRLDPTEGTVVFGEALVGERIVDGSYERLPVTVDADGTWRGHSALLLLDLCWKMEDPWYKTRLRFYNPARREWLLNFSEHEIVRRSLESEVRELRSLLGMTEPSGNGHSRGRYLVGPDESERRRQKAAAELEELRAELHRRQWPPARDQ